MQINPWGVKNKKNWFSLSYLLPGPAFKSRQNKMAFCVVKEMIFTWVLLALINLEGIY